MSRSTTRRTRTTKTLNLRDPGVTARLDATGIPGDVAAVFAKLDVSLGIVERLHATGLGWTYVREMSRTRALGCSADVAALVTFATIGTDHDQITRWARLGGLDAALRLHLKNVPLSTAQSFPLTDEHGLGSFLRMLQTITNTGIHLDDVLLWHTAGVLSLVPPYLIEEKWGPWRSAAVSHLGMRPAALAAAAGLGVSEAVEQWDSGDFDVAAMRMMAALRTGKF